VKAKKPKITTPSPKKLTKDEPLHIPLSFEDAVKMALNTPIKKKKK
jgi:hypothetical protein